MVNGTPVGAMRRLMVDVDDRPPEDEHGAVFACYPKIVDQLSAEHALLENNGALQVGTEEVDVLQTNAREKSSPQYSLASILVFDVMQWCVLVGPTEFGRTAECSIGLLPTTFNHGLCGGPTGGIES